MQDVVVESGSGLIVVVDSRDFEELLEIRGEDLTRPKYFRRLIAIPVQVSVVADVALSVLSAPAGDDVASAINDALAEELSMTGDGVIECPSHTLLIRDDDEEYARVDLDGDSCRVRVCGNDAEFPSRLVVAIEPATNT